MLKEWQFNVLFFVGVGGAVLLFFGPELGLKFDQNPVSLGGIGTILTYVLTQKKAITKHEDRPPDQGKEDSDEH